MESIFKILMQKMEKPPVDTVGTDKFWDDDYISGQMLKAHLDPEFEGASRNHQFINQSVNWINTLVPQQEYPRLLDLGCGPGLYTQRLAALGYSVTGIDYSRRSINYARESAEKLCLPIKYLCQDYFLMDYEEQFDVIILIYCDFGVLPETAREQLLSKIHKALTKKGKLILDVFTPHNYANRCESTSWEIHKQAGFWREENHLCLNGFFKYEKDIFLDMVTVLTQENISTYYLWNHCFTSPRLATEISQAGFAQYSFYNNVAGQPFSELSNTLCIVAEK